MMIKNVTVYQPFPLLCIGLVKDISSKRRNTGTFEAGADHEHDVVVHAGFDMSKRNALSTLKSRAAI